MSKYIVVAVALVAVGWAFWNYFPTFTPGNTANTPSSPLLTSFAVPSFKLPTLENAAVKVLAWETLEKYLEAAQAHNLESLRTFSHQISPTCDDPLKEKECFELMDSVYYFASEFKADDFQYIEADGKQIIMYTDGPERKMLYFTRDTGSTIKVLGLRFCSEDEENPELTCADLNADTRDSDGDGWWNSTESLFYK